MKIKEHLNFRVPLDRGAYFILGVGLFILKFNVDKLVSRMVFHRPWSFFNYLQNA